MILSIAVIVILCRRDIILRICMTLFFCSYHFSNNGHLNVVEYLVTKTNSDVNSKTKSGETPLDFARR